MYEYLYVLQQDAVLLEPRDAAINFDRYQILQ